MFWRVLRTFRFVVDLLAMAACVALCAGWIISYWTAYEWTAYTPMTTSAGFPEPVALDNFSVVIDRGRLTLHNEIDLHDYRRQARSSNGKEPQRWSTFSSLRPSNYPDGASRNAPVVHFAGFALWVYPPDPADSKPIAWKLRRTFCVTIPCWFLAPPLAILPLLRLRAAIRSRRNRFDKTRRCVVCQYDLRAHLPRQRCPECGHLIECT